MVCLNKLEWFLLVSFAIKKNFRVKKWKSQTKLQTNLQLYMTTELFSPKFWIDALRSAFKRSRLAFDIWHSATFPTVLIAYSPQFVFCNFQKNNYLHPWSIMFSNKHCAFRWFENIKNSRLTFSVRLLTVHVRSLTFCVLQLSIWVLFYQLICLNFPKKN